ncbi:MAG: hypothetical protein A3B08_00200 [Candidatus Taylorbacteria bacterium RIFCSPLOWO2_01_FULL_43_44]|nr:MAG: hypothetical protein A3B08_00200 [Candidatus Taylorbacteria bacterium RIFCSPLOWO2_01_FULL_43_44]
MKYLELASFWLVQLVTLAIAAAIIVFFWGVARYISGGDDEEKRTSARNTMLYGIIGIFSMVSVWGLVYFLGNILGIEPGGALRAPNLPGSEEGLIVDRDSKVMQIVQMIGSLLSSVIYLIISLAVLYFFWGIIRYVGGGADQEKRTEARNMIVYGIIALFAMVSIWGVVFMIGQTLGISTENSFIRVPQITEITLIGDSDGTSITGQEFTTCPEWNPNDPSGEGANFKAFVCFVLSFLNPIPPILVTLAMLYFFWGIAKYMGAGDAEELKSGRTTIIYGMLAMFIVMGVWGIAALIKAELGF